uniref:30S ribosomal protein S9 n=1 Tax=Araucaria cunninghamii TaxID=56994 RepID=A0A0D6QZW8_ARACU
MFWRRLTTLHPLASQIRSYYHSCFNPHSCIFSHFRSSNHLEQSFRGGLGSRIRSPRITSTVRNFSTGRRNGNGGKSDDADPFKTDNGRGPRPPPGDPWDFSGKADDAFEPSNGDKWDEFGSGEGSMDWGAMEADNSKDERWKDFQEPEPISFEETPEDGLQPLPSEDGEVPGVEEGDWKSAVKAAQLTELEKEEKQLMTQLEGPKRAFGDLIAATGITDVQIESLILMRNLEGVEGLPPLKELEDARLAKMEKSSTRRELELKRQQESAYVRVRKVDEKGRAYGTGRRKCSVAQVWIQPGSGKFVVNGKTFDVYFPQLAHRADLLSPFVFTKTLGLWDVVSNVKGGGVSGQVGAVRHGISRALQNWEPGLRPYLRAAGLLTRDPRVVERKKPGKAKARKSFQWVKR